MQLLASLEIWWCLTIKGFVGEEEYSVWNSGLCVFYKESVKPTWKRYVRTHESAICINWRALSGWPDDKDSIRTIIRNMCFSFVMLCSYSKNEICFLWELKNALWSEITLWFLTGMMEPWASRVTISSLCLWCYKNLSSVWPYWQKKTKKLKTSILPIDFFHRPSLIITIDHHQHNNESLLSVNVCVLKSELIQFRAVPLIYIKCSTHRHWMLL